MSCPWFSSKSTSAVLNFYSPWRQNSSGWHIARAEVWRSTLFLRDGLVAFMIHCKKKWLSRQVCRNKWFYLENPDENEVKNTLSKNESSDPQLCFWGPSSGKVQDHDVPEMEQRTCAPTKLQPWSRCWNFKYSLCSPLLLMDKILLTSWHGKYSFFLIGFHTSQLVQEFFHQEYFGKLIQFDDHIFQMGWFNHQLGVFYKRKAGASPSKSHFSGALLL